MKKQKKIVNSNVNFLDGNRKKYPFWFYLFLFLFPLLLLISIELTLRLFSYGKEYVEWVDIDKNYEILNPEIATKYFYGIENVPFSTESFLLKEKPKNGLRIITLGASSGAGYPFQNSGSFSKYIRNALRFALPDKMIEVANISMAAINSYTILDLLPEIVKKDPDLILIYLGHNEYYGALGIASKQSIGNSIWLTNSMLKLKSIRIFQLLENIIASLFTLGNSNVNNNNETLMSRIADEKIIGLNSELFNKGVDQYESNLQQILDICKSNDISVLISSLSSNLKDQKPFNSVDTDNHSSAEFLFSKARSNLKSGNYEAADSLFRAAKDNDALRFRAPEIFNRIILDLSKEYGAVFVDVDSIMNSHSPQGIVGNNLMVDHLHPNLKGYQIIGKSYTDKILENNLIDHSKINIDDVDEYVKSNFHFTKFDSTISDFRIKILKNNWPFIGRNESVDNNSLLPNSTFEEKIAGGVLSGRISRLKARIELYEHYLNNEIYTELINTLLSLMDEFPNEKEIVNQFIGDLIKLEKYEYLDKPLNKSYQIFPDEFNTKWLGIMSISNNNLSDAEKYLFESSEYNPNDPQVMFNLAGAYFQMNKYQESYQYILRCLQLSPNYRNADILKKQIENLLKQ